MKKIFNHIYKTNNNKELFNNLINFYNKNIIIKVL